jgi:hypothetical protein
MAFLYLIVEGRCEAVSHGLVEASASRGNLVSEMQSDTHISRRDSK